MDVKQMIGTIDSEHKALTDKINQCVAAQKQLEFARETLVVYSQNPILPQEAGRERNSNYISGNKEAVVLIDPLLDHKMHRLGDRNENIRRDYTQGTASASELAKKYGVSKARIFQIAGQKTQKAQKSQSKKNRKEEYSIAAKGYWSKMTPDERQKEVRRRRVVANKNKKTGQNKGKAWGDITGSAA